MDSGVASSLTLVLHIPFRYKNIIILSPDFKNKIGSWRFEHGRLLSLCLGNLAQILPRSYSPVYALRVT